MRSRNFLFLIAYGLLPIFSEIAIAETSPLCPGETGYYYVNYRRRNPTAGGFVSNEAYADDSDYIFIAPSAAICGSSKVTENAKIYGTAVIKNSSISGRSEIFGNARIQDGAEVIEEAKISEDAVVSGSVRVAGKAVVAGKARIVNYSQDNFAQVQGQARVTGSARITGNAEVSGNARVMGNSVISGNAVVNGTAVVNGFSKISDGTMSSGTRNDEDFEGIAAVKKAAADAEAALAAKKEREKRISDEREQKIKKYQDIVDKITNEGWLGKSGGEYSFEFPTRCEFKMKFRDIQKGELVSYDYSKTLDLKLKENIQFSTNDSKFYSPCVEVNLRSLESSDKSVLSYYDNQRGTTGTSNGISCIGLKYQDQEGAAGAAKLLNQLIDLCKSL